MTVSVAGAEGAQPIDFVHNVVNAPAPVPGAVFGTSPAVKTGTAILHDADADRSQREHGLRDDLDRAPQ